MKRKAAWRDHHKMGLRGSAFIGSVPQIPEFEARTLITEPKSEARDLRRTAQERYPDRCRDRLPAARPAVGRVAGPDGAEQDGAASAGRRSQFGHYQRPQLLRVQRGWPHPRQPKWLDESRSQ